MYRVCFKRCFLCLIASCSHSNLTFRELLDDLVYFNNITDGENGCDVGEPDKNYIDGRYRNTLKNDFLFIFQRIFA